MKFLNKKIYLFGFICLFLSIFSFVLAQNNPIQTDNGRSYLYDSIIANINVNKDASIDVEENLNFNFRGEYHKGWRSIPFKDIGDITDIHIIDLKTGEFLKKSYQQLNKEDPSGWGKYYLNRSNGSQNIEWYYDARDEIRGFQIKYKVHGVVRFLENIDEIYWNVFTNFDVPVLKTEVFVNIPENNFVLQDLQATAYSTSNNGKSEIINNQIAHFVFGQSLAGDDVTVAFGWPKGLIIQSLYYQDFLKSNWVFISSIILILLTISFIFIYWFFTEKMKKGRGIVIPQYEPPKNLRPAMAELIVKERLSPRSWAATVIDLAVRGYVKIEEKADKYSKVKKNTTTFFLILFFLVVFYVVFANSFANSFFPWIIFIILTNLIIFVLRGKFSSKDYTVSKNKEYKGDNNLHDYEIKFLDILLSRGNRSFDTEYFKKNRMEGRELFLDMKNLEKELLKETDKDINVFEKSLYAEKNKTVFFSVLIFVILFGFVIFGPLANQNLLPWWVILIVLFLCVLSIYFFIKFEARLSFEGRILKEEWLGFKMYLEKAEKYRMQNLTPETFEKYLPYAIIFGVEKKWGKAFEGISINYPSWYHSPYMGSVGIHTETFGVGNFSASVFSSSFSSSFASAFSSSGAGGSASGGGGGAGGGGGGGGGGAS